MTHESRRDLRIEDVPDWLSGRGCKQCGGTGYKGRVGAYVILTKEPEIEKAILGGVISEYEMREIAQRQGMVTMTQDGLLKASEGQTSIEEVKRIVGL